MAKCLSCRKADNCEVPIPADPVELREVFDDIWYCLECATAYNVKWPEPARLRFPEEWNID